MQDEFIDDQPPIGALTPEARESLRLAMEDTPADHPDSAGHAPGPWSIDTYRLGDKDLFVSEAGAVIDIDDCAEVERAERFANARLIAAAPELLEALQDAETYLVERGIDIRGVTGRTVILPKMQAAIAKATGRATP